MPIFSAGKLIPIEVKYVDLKLKDGTESSFVIDTPELEKRFADKIKTFKTQWQVPNWKDNNEAIRLSLVIDPNTGDKTVDYSVYRAQCLERFLKAWDAQTADGHPIPVTVERINALEFSIAKTLADKFIFKHIPTDEELGN